LPEGADVSSTDRRPTLVTTLLGALALLATALSAATATRPNLIIILTDDHGYADVGFNGCKDIPTPHLDSIAPHGVQFTNGYYTFGSPATWQAGTPPTAYQLAKPYPGTSVRDAIAGWAYDAYAAFIQDTWKPNQQLTLLGGKWDGWGDGFMLHLGWGG